jgi:hypothetical protein
MKLSNETIDVLKNFSNINQNLLVKEGSQLRTMSTMKNILAEVDVSETMPKEFGIYDLTEFLGVLTLVQDPELEFNHDSYLTVNGGPTKISYFYSDPSILVTPPDTFNEPETDVEFTVTKNSMSKVQKASAVMQLPDIVFTGTTQGITMSVTDKKNSTSNMFQETFDNTGNNEGAFQFDFKIENLKIMPDDYSVTVSTEALVSCWRAVNKKVVYWIALEQPSD